VNPPPLKEVYVADFDLPLHPVDSLHITSNWHYIQPKSNVVSKSFQSKSRLKFYLKKPMSFWFNLKKADWSFIFGHQRNQWVSDSISKKRLKFYFRPSKKPMSFWFNLKKAIEVLFSAITAMSCLKFSLEFYFRPKITQLVYF